MRTGVIAKKMGMTRLFQDDGRHVPVTVLSLEDVQVVAAAKQGRDGYTSPSSSARARPRRRMSPSRSAATSARPKWSPRRWSREFRVDEDGSARRGRRDLGRPFRRRPAGRHPGKTQGKGFAGGMKRWGFGGLRATHGVSVSHRSHGSTGQRQDPGKRLQEQEDGRPHGRPPAHPAEPRDRPHRRRARPALRQGFGAPARRARWLLVKDAVKVAACPRRCAVSRPA